MSLDQQFLDSVGINIVKKKYYNANKVNALLEDIRQRMLALNEENASLREQLSQMNSKKAEIGDTLMSAQSLARQIVDGANKRAENIIAEAEEQRRVILSQSSSEQERAARSVEACIEELRQEHLKCIDMLNVRLQNFLCELNLPDMPDDAPQTTDDGLEPPSGDEERAKSAMPSAAELEARVAAIAKELREIIG